MSEDNENEPIYLLRRFPLIFCICLSTSSPIEICEFLAHSDPSRRDLYQHDT